VLTILDLFVSVGPGSTEYWKVLVNRGLALFAITVTSTLGIQRNRAAEESRKHLEVLARTQRAQTVEHLAMAIAHELNQPLAACSLQAELALALMPASMETGGTSQRLRPLLENVVEQSQRASSILRSLRELVQNGRGERSTVAPNELVKSALRWFEPSARPHRIRLELELAQQLPSVVGDRVQLEQVLLNLLQNACDAFLSSNAVERTITLRTAVSMGGVRISVSDSGPGVSPEIEDKLFDRFYTTKPDGMGIGLAMSRSIVEAHGGRIWLEHATAPSGATFTIELPPEAPELS
jgi:signal transduction histidine kinase